MNVLVAPGVGRIDPRLFACSGLIVALLVAILATTAAFARIDRRAAVLLVPYLCWVGFATALNFEL